MKKKTTVLLMLLFVSCSRAQWEKVSESNISFTHTVAGFVNEHLGITAGYAGEIHYTNDSGKEWPRAQNNTMCRFAIDALDSGELIHAGNGGTVSFSEDGTAWTKLETPVSGKIVLVNFFNSERGSILTSSGEIKYTVDAGKSWKNMDKPQNDGFIIAIDHFSSDEVAVIDNKGNLHRSDDLGSTWSSVALPAEEYKLNWRLSANAVALRFKDDQTFTIAVIAPAENSKNSAVVVLRSDDGGIHFSGEKIPCNLNPTATIFLSPDSGYLTVNE